MLLMLRYIHLLTYFPFSLTITEFTIIETLVSTSEDVSKWLQRQGSIWYDSCHIHLEVVAAISVFLMFCCVLGEIIELQKMHIHVRILYLDISVISIVICFAKPKFEC